MCSICLLSQYAHFYIYSDIRRFAETIMNERSSRSHTIYRLTLESKEMDGDMVKVSVLVSFNHLTSSGVKSFTKCCNEILITLEFG